MGFTDLFKPKWKHSNVAVRTDAVKQLSADDTAILVQVAKNDVDEGVRRLALRKIASAEVLSELAEQHLEGELRDVALERASSLWLNDALSDDADAARAAFERITTEAAIAEVAKRCAHADLRMQALERLTDPRTVAEVARQAKDDETKLAAVAALDDATALRGLASGEHREVALAALGRIDDPEQLRLVAKQAKIKAVRSRAEKRAQQLSSEPVAARATEEPSAEELREHQRAQLIRICEELTSVNPSVDDPDVEQRHEQLRARWLEIAKALGADAADIRARFDETCDQFRAERKAFTERLEREFARQTALRADAASRADVCAQAEALRESDPDERADALIARWNDLGPVPEGHAEDFARRFDVAIRRFRERRGDLSKRAESDARLAPLLAQAEAAVQMSPLAVARRELAAVRREYRQVVDEVGVSDEYRAKFQAAQERLDQRSDEERAARQGEQQANLERLTKTIERLEGFASAEEGADLKGAEQCLKDARAAIKKPGPLPSKGAFNDLRSRFEKAERAVQSRVQEQREASEWGRLFNVPRQEELCRQAEELASIEDLAEIAQKLRTLQAEWKKVGAVPRGKSEELWTRFKTACDAAYAKCGTHFEDLKKERAENLKAKEALCVEAESIAESTEWNATADKLKQLQAKWKEIGPVDRKDSNAIWKRFRAACDCFFERRKEHFEQLDEKRAENLKIKTELCEKAEALADSSDWQETADRLKALQDEWKGIGPVPKKHSDEIWARFRGACDRFFARRESHLDGGRQQNFKRKMEICAELESLAAPPADDAATTEQTVATVLERWKEWRTVGPIPFDEVEPSEQRFRAALGKILEARGAGFAKTELDPVAIKARRQKLIESMEELVSTLKGTEETDAGATDIAERLRAAMARNTFKTEAELSVKQQVEEKAEGLLASWQRLPPLPGGGDEALEARFADAYRAAVGHAIGENADSDRPSRPPRRDGGGRGRRRDDARPQPESAAPAAPKDAPAPAARPAEPEPTAGE